MTYHEMEDKYIVISRWSCIKRIYATSVLMVFFVSFMSVVGLSQGDAWGAIQNAGSIAMAAIIAIIIISPETWIQLRSRSVARGIAIGGRRIALYRLKIADVDDPVVVKKYEALPRTRRKGWYLGILRPNDRVTWYGYARHRRDAIEQASELREVLNANAESGANADDEHSGCERGTRK
ncbi:MAG: hypothetical protein JSV91_04100 [Phycisphaerales bacterium]|nr:MAG: hypothetical protein JSV91_04100 [Phycisphaerales bacterium]